MKIYQKFADYYDTLYGYKNYFKESSFLNKLFKKYFKKKKLSILDVGCGTGSHALILAKFGHKVTGVDLSDKMIKVAKKKAKESKIKVDFKKGDARKTNLKKKFDVVLLMFNVIGYQLKNEEVASVFKTAGRHLKKGGLLVFDCWFGPAVLSQKPEKRRKIIKKNKSEKLIKSANPSLDILSQTVGINYQIIRIAGKKILDKVEEIHKIRFLFPQEINNYLKGAGFQLVNISPFMRIDKKPTLNDWNITVIAKKI